VGDVAAPRSLFEAPGKRALSIRVANGDWSFIT
jgi:hypothetical protein